MSRPSECPEEHPRIPVMCAHFDGENACVYPDDLSSTGFMVTSWRTGRPGSVSSEIPRPLETYFEEWCDSWVRNTPAKEGVFFTTGEGWSR